MKLNEWLLPVVTPLLVRKKMRTFHSRLSTQGHRNSWRCSREILASVPDRERALTDEQILNKVNKDARGRVFDSVDEAEKIFPNFHKKIRMLSTLNLIRFWNSNCLKRQSTTCQNTGHKKISEAARKKKKSFNARSSSWKKLCPKRRRFAEQGKGSQTRLCAKNKAFGIELAPEFATDKHKNFLADSTISSLKKNFVLEFDEKDQSIIHLRKNVDG